jgi:hypothetical protein
MVHLVRSFVLLACLLAWRLTSWLPVWPTVAGLLGWLVGLLACLLACWLWLAVAGCGWLAGLADWRTVAGWLWLVVAYRRRRSSSARAALECAARFIFEESASRNVNAA